VWATSSIGQTCRIPATGEANLRPQKAKSLHASLAAPVGGWNARDAVAAMPELDAVIMDNVWPTTSDVMLRKGYTEWATGIPTQVQTLISYQSTTADELFAAAGTEIYDVTTQGAVGAAVVTGMSNAQWQYTNISNTAGNWLIAVNGADTPRLYNGATWSTTAITGVTQANLIHVNLFKNRVWFVEKDTMNAWYLGVDAIAGAATKFPLSAIATRGGYLMAMATWTIDAGEGVDDYAAFITSEGEVIVYIGTDPTSASTFALKGVWQMGSPIGRRCYLKYGGDLLLICYDGVQLMSKALQSTRVDPRAALTDKIQGAMSEAASLYNANFGWQLDFCPNNSRVMLNVPVTLGEQMQFAMNTITGAWCRFTGIDANCWEQFQNVSYFGGDGVVGLFWDGANDAGDIVEGDVLQAFSTFGNPGLLKRWTMAQLFFSASGPPAIDASINVDYDTALSNASVQVSPATAGLWDDGLWDDALWGGGLANYKPYVGLTGLGKSAGMRLAMASDQLEIHWQATNFVYEGGGFL